MPTQTTYSIGPIEVDEDNRSLRRGDKIVPLAPRCFPLLRILAQHLNKTVLHTLLERHLRHRGNVGASIRSKVSLIRDAFRKLEHPEFTLLIESIHDSGYLLVYRQTNSDLPDVNGLGRNIAFQTSSSGRLSVLIDGMILDAVAELLMHDESMLPIIRRGRQTYQRSVEDFAFSVVYASSIESSTDHVDRTGDPGRYSRADIFAQLPGVWKFHTFGDDLKKGAILRDTRRKELIKADIQVAARCLDKFEWPFRDWLSGEVQRHLGNHESLFEEGLRPEEYVFKAVALSPYREPDLQCAFGEKATSRTIEFLRRGQQPSQRNFSASALREFATSSVVAMITIMHENDLSAQRSNIWRIPHVVRSLIKQEVLIKNEMPQQSLLKSIVVQHALAAALRQVNEIDRRSFITTLMNMRGASPIKEIREILEDRQLLLSKPRQQDESKALATLKEIKRLADLNRERPELFILDKRSVLRELDIVSSDHYEAQLYRVFPALRPTSHFL